MTQPKKDIHDVIRYVIGNMNNKMEFQSIIDEGDNVYKVESCNTLWLMINDKLKFSGEEFEVIEIVPNEYFKVKGAVLYEPTSPIELKRPYYFHGTIRKTNQELNEVTFGPEKFPMVYCFEIFRETFHQEKSDPNERTSDLRLFFLGTSDKEDWLTEEHYVKTIIPLRAMLGEFITFIDNRNGFGRLEDYTTINHVDFGTFTNDQGKLQNLFDDELSGVELDISLVVKKSLDCEGFCPDC